jgi:hypothetical protein
MITQSHKRALYVVIALTLTATLLWTSKAGGRASTLQYTDPPTVPGIFQCDGDGEYQVTFNWTRRMPGSGAWLGTINVRQGTQQILNKPIQVFDAKGTEPVVRQFQAQDGSFYCRVMSTPSNRRSFSFSECRNWLLADQTCVRQRPTTSD